MNYYITIDGGTTNTRVSLVVNKKVVESRKIALGAKDCIYGSNALKSAITEDIDNICLQNNIVKSDIKAIVASGMITSEYGLFPLGHLSAPVGVGELHKGLVRAENMFGTLPCYFIPGVKKLTESPETTDMMRGEETEIAGLLADKESDRTVFILPGSHSKHIYLDSEGRISNFKTMLTGEMISALANGTILKGTISLDFDKFYFSALISGYDAAESLGLNDALFKVRIMKNLFGKSDLECYSFFIGAIMEAEVRSLKNSGANAAVIG
jgi:2-dehydro-3-deoxygalactonokinase